MAKKDGKPGFIDKIRHKYRLSIYRDATYEEVLNLKLSRLNVFALTGIATVLFLAIIVSLIAYTPLREFIPGYPDENTLRNIVLNDQRLDSLEMELNRRDRYFDNMRLIISGEEPNNYENIEDTSISYESINFTRSSEDSTIRQLFEEEKFDKFIRLQKLRKINNIGNIIDKADIVNKNIIMLLMAFIGSILILSCERNTKLFPWKETETVSIEPQAPSCKDIEYLFKIFPISSLT